MYLKRFSRPKGGGFQMSAANVYDANSTFTTDIKNVGVERGFYWGSDQLGIPHHHMEAFLSKVEASASSAFRRVLDTGKLPSDDAFPRWPLPEDTRLTMSWWIAAQILRTTRQRARLDLLPDSTIDAPRGFGAANRHIAYIVELIGPLAAALFHRPWGVGFSDYCLLTGDVPVLVLNGQDVHDQLLAVAYWDIYLPLDPHRCLYLPGVSTRAKIAPSVDHKAKFHPGIAIALNNAVADTAVKHIFWHPEHDPSGHLQLRARRPIEEELGADWLPRYLVTYDVLHPDFGVERRWLEHHPPSRTDDPVTPQSQSETEIVDIVTSMSDYLDQAVDGFRKLQERSPRTS
jgi:hypothetical protein